MTKKEIVELYGKSIYQIRLDIALWHWQHQELTSPDQAWMIADKFVEYMKSNEHKRISD